MTKQEISLEEKIRRILIIGYDFENAQFALGATQRKLIALFALQQKQSLAVLREKIWELRIKLRHSYKDETKNKDRYARVITYNKAIKAVLSLLQDKEVAGDIDATSKIEESR